MGSEKRIFATAIYDNEAESDEELDFKKNDILEILDKDEDDGWWLCKLNDKTGLAAANRLKILNKSTSSLNIQRDKNNSRVL